MDGKSSEISEEACVSLERRRRADESLSDVIVRMCSNTRTHLIRRICFVIWGYSFALWLYTIAYQLRYPYSIYDVLAWWLPIRMDYIGEAAFAASFIFAVIMAAYHASEP